MTLPCSGARNGAHIITRLDAGPVDCELRLIQSRITPEGGKEYVLFILRRGGHAGPELL